MVYESDFYTTRRSYRTSPSLTSYTVSKREIPWEKVPFVPRPSLVPDPVTAFGKRRPEQPVKQERKSILSPEERAKIKPKAYLEPIRPYVSAREQTKEKSVPSRQVRVLPGLGKVHVSYSYDRVVPYVGHKRLTVVTMPPRVFSTRPSVLQREYDRIENKLRPWTGYSATNRYLNSDSSVRSYYISYPITGYNYYYSLNLPSSSYLPKVYRWYYSWPRLYSSWPSYRWYLSSYLRNYYLNSYSPSWYYWSSYWPYYRSVDYDFSELENKIDNLREMLTYLRNPISGFEYSFWPDAKFFYHYKIYRPLSFHIDWPITGREWYPEYWPSYSSYWHYLRDVPTEKSFRKLRIMLKLRYDHIYGNQVRWYPSSRYYYDDALGPLSTYWPLGYNRLFPYHWPVSLLDLWPTEHHLRKIRVRNNLYTLR